MKNFAPRIRALRTAMREKGLKDPNVRLEIGNSDNFDSEVRCYWWKQNFSAIEYPKIELPKDDPEAALSQLETWIKMLPDADTRAQHEAVAELGRAIDGVKATGIEIDAMRIQFDGIYENLLTAV